MPKLTERQRPGLIGHSWTSGSQTTVVMCPLNIGFHGSSRSSLLDTAQRAVAMEPNSAATTTSSAGSGQGADQETHMLLSSLREVISNQAQEIQTLQKNIKDLTTSSKTKDDEVRYSLTFPHSRFTEPEFIDYISERPGGITKKASYRRRRQEEGE